MDNNFRSKIELDSVQHFIKIGLIHERTCIKCNKKCIIYSRKRSAKAEYATLTWRCTTCKSYFSMFEGMLHNSLLIIA